MASVRSSYSGNFSIKGEHNGSNNRFTGTNFNIIDSKTAELTASSGTFTSIQLPNLLSKTVIGTDSNGDVVDVPALHAETLLSASLTLTNAEMTPGVTTFYQIVAAPAAGSFIFPKYSILESNYVTPYTSGGGSFVLRTQTGGPTTWLNFSVSPDPMTLSSQTLIAVCNAATSIITTDTGLALFLRVNAGYSGGDAQNTTTVTVYYTVQSITP